MVDAEQWGSDLTRELDGLHEEMKALRTGLAEIESAYAEHTSILMQKIHIMELSFVRDFGGKIANIDMQLAVLNTRISPRLQLTQAIISVLPILALIAWWALGKR